MGLDYRTFVADDGGLGTTAYPGDEDGEASAISESETESPRVRSENEDCDGAHSESDDELRSDAEADELAKKLAVEVSHCTSSQI